MKNIIGIEEDIEARRKMTSFGMFNSTNETDPDDYDPVDTDIIRWSELGPVLAIYSLTFCLGLAGTSSNFTTPILSRFHYTLVSPRH